MNKKSLAGVFLALMLLSFNFVLAADCTSTYPSTGGQPFQGVWNAINQISCRIDSMGLKVDQIQNTSGIDCWDLNSNRLCDLSAEDIDLDGLCTALDCKGTQGIQGPIGPQGVPGIQGEQGPVGPQGIQGITGHQGEKGDKGDKGETGDTGLQGLQGETGTMGPQGLKGDKGDTGAQGIRGETGATGPQGPQGIQGETGSQGEKGDKGDKGDTGSTGPQGLPGEVGPQGAQGIQGITGEKGDTGSQGQMGPIGPQGIQGLKGDIGAQGATGFINDTRIFDLYGVANFYDLFTQIKTSLNDLQGNFAALNSRVLGLENKAQMSVIKSGTGSGVVTSAPDGIACGSLCWADYAVNSTVALTATPDPTSIFAGWSGACTGTGACTLTMTSARGVTATFAKNSYPVTVTRTGPGTVTSSQAGIFCGGACSYNFDMGSMVILTAAPDTSASFAGWSGSCTGTSSTCTVTVDSAKSVSAYFTTNNYELTVARAGAGSVISTPSGLDCGSTCLASYGSGTVVTLSAIPDSQSIFAGWSGACSGLGVCTVTMSAARSVTATFNRGNMALVVAKSGNGGGTVASSPLGINCGATCTANYVPGTSVILTASSDSASSFSGWSGACGGTSSCTVTMDAAKAAVATFTKNTYLLSIIRSGDGMVTSNIGGIYCGASCSGSVEAGTQVTLTATPSATSTFTGWSGGSCSGTAPCTITMDGAKSVSATFITNTNALTVSRTGGGGGTVISSPSGISCGLTCYASYNSGTLVSLSAMPDSTYTFAGWTGDCTGTGACIVTMSAAKSVTATFNRNNYLFTVTKTGTGGGIVTSDPAGINCGYSCSASYSAGSTVALVATPDSYSYFAGWSGACSGTGGCTVTIDQAKSLQATFIKRSYSATVTRTGGGTVASSLAGVYCGALCSSAYDSGTVVTFMAIPDSGATFMGWSGACTGTSTTCTVTMDAAKTVSASFTVPLTVVKLGTGSGTITSSPAGISCAAGTCSSAFNGGQTVTLIAAPSGSSTFAGWSGACLGTGTCTVAMDAAKLVGASFN